MTPQVSYMNSGPVVAMAWEGQGAVKTGRFGQGLKSNTPHVHVRVMLGETNPAASKPGTIRGDYCIQVTAIICIHVWQFICQHPRLVEISAMEVMQWRVLSMRLGSGLGEAFWWTYRTQNQWSFIMATLQR